jgi:hypothetical protein
MRKIWAILNCGLIGVVLPAGAELLKVDLTIYGMD